MKLSRLLATPNVTFLILFFLFKDENNPTLASLREARQLSLGVF